jgi:acyl-CoA thioester hydrolase
MTGPFSITLSVRDYECDLQGVVNNAVYQNYLEHARHEFLKSMQIDFAALAREGTNLVVVRAELDYLKSLTSGDIFEVKTHLSQVSRLKFAFHQSIVIQPENVTVVKAIVTGVALNPQGRPFMPDYLKRLSTEQHISGS